MERGKRSWEREGRMGKEGNTVKEEREMEKRGS